MTLYEVEEYGEKMENFDEEAHPFEKRLPIDDDGITYNSCTDEGHRISDQYDEPMPGKTDKFMNKNVLLPMGECYERATVIHRKHNSSGETIGRRNANPFLDTRVYESEFLDGKGVVI